MPPDDSFQQGVTMTTLQGNAGAAAATAPQDGQSDLSSTADSSTQPAGMTLGNALMDVRNRDVLYTLYMWSALMVGTPLILMYITYNVCRQVLQFDLHSSLSVSGITSAVSVMMICILYGMYAYYDDDDRETNKHSGVNWFTRDDRLEGDKTE